MPQPLLLGSSSLFTADQILRRQWQLLLLLVQPWCARSRQQWSGTSASQQPHCQNPCTHTHAGASRIHPPSRHRYCAPRPLQSSRREAAPRSIAAAAAAAATAVDSPPWLPADDARMPLGLVPRMGQRGHRLRAPPLSPSSSRPAPASPHRPLAGNQSKCQRNVQVGETSLDIFIFFPPLRYGQAVREGVGGWE